MTMVKQFLYFIRGLLQGGRKKLIYINENFKNFFYKNRKGNISPPH